MNPIHCSVGILTFNVEKTLPKALDSVRLFDDIIVCDGGSTDDTLSIARQYNARVITQDNQYKNQDGSIADFSGVRNQMLEAAKHKWFLFIDSDEYLSEDVVTEIRSVIEKPLTPKTPMAYRLRRVTVVNNVIIACATAYPNYQMRFFHMDGVTRFVKAVHERISLKPETLVGTLSHPEYVPLHNEAEMKRKQLYYLSIEVERHKDDTFLVWVRGPLKDSVRSSLSYALRHIRLLLFCSGPRMPIWVENMHHWYNWKLITMTGAKFFRRSKFPKHEG